MPIKIFILTFLLLLNISYASTSFEDKTETNYTFEDQFEVASKRQQSGTPFDAPLEINEGWQLFFNQAISRTRTALKDNQDFPEDHKSDLFNMLEMTRSEGEALFINSEMDTHWYLFLHRLMAEILSLSQKADADRHFASNLYFCQPKELEEALENFSKEHFLRKNHLIDVRTYLESFHETPENNDYNPAPSEIENQTYPFDVCNNSLPINMDCFYLPYLGSREQALFPIKLMNQVMSHRICLIGVPTTTAHFDATRNASSRTFMYHDLYDHGVLFNRLSFPITKFDPREDPLVKALHPILSRINDLEKANTQTLAHIALFDGVHEGLYSPFEPHPFPFGVDLDRYNFLEECIKTQLLQKSPQSFYPTTTKGQFFEAFLSLPDDFSKQLLEMFDSLVFASIYELPYPVKSPPKC